MSDKMECPGCEAYTSGVLHDFQEEEPCRFCGLPFEAAFAILVVRDKKANADVTKMFEEAISRATRAEDGIASARRLIRDIRAALDEYEKGSA